MSRHIGSVIDDCSRELLESYRFTPSELAVELDPKMGQDAFGLYAVFVSAADVLPEPYRSEVKSRDTDLVYVGKAVKQTLFKRCVEQEFAQKGNGTFFRSIGAALGFSSPAGSLVGKANRYNYRFSNDDADSIRKWMAGHLRCSIWRAGQPDAIDDRPIIEAQTPLFNDTDNPSSFGPLADARRRCREIGLSLSARSH